MSSPELTCASPALDHPSKTVSGLIDVHGTVRGEHVREVHVLVDGEHLAVRKIGERFSAAWDTSHAEAGPHRVRIEAIATDGTSVGIEGSVVVDPAGGAYRAWRQRATPAAAELVRMRRSVAAFPSRPLVTVIVDESAGERERLPATLRSLDEQVYEHVELIRGKPLAEALEAARGDFVTVVGTGDILQPEALYALTRVVVADQRCGLVYADEDLAGDEGGRQTPLFKPDWSPDLMRCTNYVGRPWLARTALVREVGTTHAEHALLLRVSERTRSIRHLPQVLYTRGHSAPTPAGASGRTVVGEPSVSVIITTDRPAALRPLLTALTYPRCEVLVGEERHRATGELLLFLHDDVVPISRAWIEALAGHAQVAEIGAVGAKLVRHDGTIEHAGYIMGRDNQPRHAYRGTRDLPILGLTRNCVAVSSACLMIRRSVLEEVGGFREELRGAYRDADLGLRLAERGYRVVWTPDAVLRHDDCPASDGEPSTFHKLWGDMSLDPYFNPNLSRESELHVPDENVRTAQELTDDGERMIPTFHKGRIIYGEHVARYHAVLPLIAGRKVLDIACGSGYGTHLLSSRAEHVTGVDISADAIQHAWGHFTAANVDYRLGSATQIPLDDASVDVVVSFETIEHIQGYRQFLAEVKRVLRPGGQLIVSTPNKDEFLPGNHFHVHEFRADEFRAVLAEHFAHQRWWLQDTWLYSALFDEETFEAEKILSVQTAKTVAAPSSKALYFVAVCSDAPLQTGLDSIGAVAEPWSARDAQSRAEEIEKQFNVARANQASLIAQLDTARTNIERAEAVRIELERSLQAVHDRLAASEQQLGEIVMRKDYRALEWARGVKDRIIPRGSRRDRVFSKVVFDGLGRLLKA
jgi:2-polyprenyl-3-methyl-5-hydroxy-6-metoxy-1,4-benzoquinol methylase